MHNTLQGKDAVEFLETLIVGDVASLEDRTGTLSVFTNEKGGIIDDSVITKVSVAPNTGAESPSPCTNIASCMSAAICCT